MKQLTIFALLLLMTATGWGATYYVDPLGTNDALHGTSTGAGAWLTLTYALGTNGVPLTGGPHVLSVASATYTETNYLPLARSYGTTVTVQPTSGHLGDVTVVGSAGNYGVLQTGAIANIAFSRIAFINRPGAGDYVFTLYTAAGFTVTNLSFSNCTFSCDSGGLYAFDWQNGSGTGITESITFTDCIFIATAAGRAAFSGTNCGQSSTLIFTGCTFISAGAACSLDVATSTTFNRCRFRGSGSYGYGLRLGLDAATNPGTVGGSIDCCIIESAASHTLLLGAGCNGVAVRNTTAIGGDYGLVAKKAVACDVTNCILTGGTRSGLFIKGADSCAFTYNAITSAVNGEPALTNTDNDAAYKSTNCTITNNRMIATTQMINWATDQDGGGNIIDENHYCLTGDGNFGTILGTSNILTVDAMADAWTGAGYSPSGNDDDSTVDVLSPNIFLNASGGDFRLKKGSPCIDAGTNLGDDYDLDYAGYDQDKYGLGWDIGAYAYRPKFIFTR